MFNCRPLVSLCASVSRSRPALSVVAVPSSSSCRSNKASFGLILVLPSSDTFSSLVPPQFSIDKSVVYSSPTVPGCLPGFSNFSPGPPRLEPIFLDCAPLGDSFSRGLPGCQPVSTNCGLHLTALICRVTNLSAIPTPGPFVSQCSGLIWTDGCGLHIPPTSLSCSICMSNPFYFTPCLTLFPPPSCDSGITYLVLRVPTPKLSKTFSKALQLHLSILLGTFR